MKHFIKHLLLYIYNKVKKRHLVKFYWSSYFSHRCKFEGITHIGRNTDFFGSVGYGTYIADNCFLSADIGRFCSIGAGCRYINATHPYKTPFATTSPYFVSVNPTTYFGQHSFATKQMMEEFLFYDKERQIVNKIGSDVWIGIDVTLIGGVEIGDGAVVLTKAVVTKSVPPYAIVGGIPAKIIGYRYDEETIKFLLETKWWNKSQEWLKQNANLLCDIQALKDYFKKERKSISEDC